MVSLINEIENLVKKPLKQRRPTWLEILGEEKIESLNELIRSWLSKQGALFVFPTKHKLYDYLMGQNAEYIREMYFDKECYPTYKRFCEYMNEFRPRNSCSIAEQGEESRGGKGGVTS